MNDYLARDVSCDPPTPEPEDRYDEWRDEQSEDLALKPITAKVQMPQPVICSHPVGDRFHNLKRRHARLLLALKKITEMGYSGRAQEIAKAAIEADEESGL